MRIGTSSVGRAPTPRSRAVVSEERASVHQAVGMGLRLLFATTFGAGLHACGGADLPNPSSLADSPPPLYAAAVAEAWAAGGVDDLGGVAFESQVPQLVGTFGPNGQVLVIDGNGPHVFVLDQRGHLRAKIGRRGQGPGEFQRPAAGGFLGDTLLWVSDSGLQRFSWFDLEGGLAEVRPLPVRQVPGTPFTVRPSRILEGGHVVGVKVEGPDEDELPNPLVFWGPGQDGEMRVADWIASTAPRNQQITTAAGIRVTPPRLFIGTPIFGVATGGGWAFVLHRDPEAAASGVIPVVRYSPAGETLDTVRIALGPFPLTEDMRAEAREMAENSVRLLPPLVDFDVNELLAAMWLPDHPPPVRQALADSGGFWLQTDLRPPHVWLRYDLQGRLVTEAALPVAVRVMSATPTSFLASARDSLGVTVVRRFDVTLTPLRSGP